MAANNNRFNCKECKWGRYCDEDMIWPGSKGPSPIKGKFTIKGVIESEICFLPMITEQSNFMLRLYIHYRNKILPFEGGLLNQPNKYLSAMEIISQVV